MEVVKSSGEIARPLRILVPLIIKDLEAAKEAAKEAAAPHYQGVADKMVEARSQMSYSETVSWARRNFKFGETQTKRYLTIGRNKEIWGRAHAPKNMEEALRAAGGHQRGAARGGVGWREPVKEAIGKVNLDAMRQDALARQEERSLQRKLALHLIDIGYKALASKLHPDKGGSKDAMARLNRVREILKKAVTA